MNKEHNHDVDYEDWEVQELKNKLLEFAGKDLTLTLRQVFDKYCVPHPKGHKLTWKKMEPSMFYQRSLAYPKIPRSIEEVPDLITQCEDLNRNFLGNVVMPDGRHIGSMFGDAYLIDKLQGNRKCSFDGTFFTTPRLYYQCFTLFALVDNHAFPCIVTLMDGKDSLEYEQVFAKIKQLIPAFDPVRAMADFEAAPRNEAKDAWTNLIVSCCVFHYAKAVFLKMRKIGMDHVWKNCAEFKKWMRKAMCVVLCPAEHIKQLFLDLIAIQIPTLPADDQTKFLALKRYLKNYWYKYDPQVLSAFALDVTTNNAAESFHSHLKKDIKVAHPSLWTWVFHINHIFGAKKQDYMRMLENGPDGFLRSRRKELVQKLEKRKEYEAQLTNGTIDVHRFLSLVSHSWDTSITQFQRMELPNEAAEPDQAVEQLVDNNPQAAALQPNPVPRLTGDCVICLEPKDGIFSFNCNHAFACRRCSNEMIRRGQESREGPRCPLCRVELYSFDEIFF